jgi:alpha-tubulin suppressor-like RCC1 family protein
MVPFHYVRGVALGVLVLSLADQGITQTPHNQDPALDRVTESWNGTETTVTIYGSNFGTALAITLGNEPLKVGKQEKRIVTATRGRMKPGTYLLKVVSDKKETVMAVEVETPGTEYVSALDAPVLTNLANPLIADVRLLWTKWPHVSSYSVKRATVEAGPYETIAEGLKDVTFSDKPVGGAKKVFYLVGAISGTVVAHSNVVEAIVPDLDGIPTVAAGSYHSLAMRAGLVVSWGSNSHGQLGNGKKGSPPSDGEPIKDESADLSTPIPVSDLSGIQKVVGGLSFSLASSDKGVWAWGSNISGQLGNGTLKDSSKPIKIPKLEHVTGIAAGWSHGLAIADGKIWAWGSNSCGQLGNGQTKDSYVPVSIDGLTDIVEVAAGAYHSLARNKDGKVFAWGLGTDGQLGTGESGDRHVPVEITIPGKIIQLAAGAYHSLARTDKLIWTWGSNSNGQLGDGTPDEPGPNRRGLKPALTKDIGPRNVTWIGAGGYHSLAIVTISEVRDSARQLWTWGGNRYGQLGIGTNLDSDVPVPVTSKELVDVKSVAGGLHHTLASIGNGRLYAWGSNSNGQLGNGKKTASDAKVPDPNAPELLGQ